MITDLQIIDAIPQVLKTIDIPQLGAKQQGKVRDFYFDNNQRILITTDRQSAFDVILGHIPYKGAVLNQLSAFWFEQCQDIIENHMISVPDANVMIGKNCEGVPVEMIVRGYITGSTKTSIWYSYINGQRTIYGIDFPDGLKKNEKLSQPVITPTTHAEQGGHDERLTREEIISNGLVSEELYSQMEQTALALFEKGSEICEKAGLMLVDTKYEFGLYEGKLIQIDEMHTPDSSRFWIKDTYAERFANNEEPENFDKEFLRLWYAQQGYTGMGNPPEMDQQLIVAVAKRYVEVYEKITGKEFEVFQYPIEERIKENLKKAGIL